MARNVMSLVSQHITLDQLVRFLGALQKGDPTTGIPPAYPWLRIVGPQRDGSYTVTIKPKPTDTD